MRVTSCTGSTQRILGILKKSVSCVETRHRTRRVDFRGSQRPDEFACYGCCTRWGADGKARIERMCISHSYVKTFNSKVIKGFVPELRSHKCFLCFEIPMFYVYMLWTFYVRFTYLYHGYGTKRIFSRFHYNQFFNCTFFEYINIRYQIFLYNTNNLYTIIV